MGLDFIVADVHETIDKKTIVGAHPSIPMFTFENAFSQSARLGDIGNYDDFIENYKDVPSLAMRVASPSSLKTIDTYHNSNQCMFSGDLNALEGYKKNKQGTLNEPKANPSSSRTAILVTHSRVECDSIPDFIDGLVVNPANLSGDVVRCARKRAIKIGVVDAQTVADIRRAICKYKVDFISTKKPLLYRAGTNCSSKPPSQTNPVYMLS